MRPTSAGQVIDIYVYKKRNTAATRRFFDTVLGDHGRLKARLRSMRGTSIYESRPRSTNSPR
jgi:hypothetical protein